VLDATTFTNSTGEYQFVELTRAYLSLSYNLHPDPSGITLTPSAA